MNGPYAHFPDPDWTLFSWIDCRLLFPCRNTCWTGKFLKTCRYFLFEVILIRDLNPDPKWRENKSHKKWTQNRRIIINLQTIFFCYQYWGSLTFWSNPDPISGSDSFLQWLHSAFRVKAVRLLKKTVTTERVKAVKMVLEAVRVLT